MATKIIALAENSWDGPWMNRQQILSRLGKSSNILYSNGPFYSWSRSRPIFKESPFLGRMIYKDKVLVDLPPKYLLKYQGLKMTESIVDYLTALRWKRALKVQSHDELIVYVFSPAFYDFIKYIKPDKVVYHIYDMFSASPGWNESLQRKHEALISQADVVFASSDEIKKSALECSVGSDVTVIENGVDYDAFSSVDNYQEPVDIKDISSPRIGYTGNINMKVDMALVVNLAARHPEWSFVFIGGIGELGEQAQFYKQARNLSNIYFLGRKPVVDLPAYMSSMDINIMLYSINKNLWSFSGYPLKMHEYLAVGKPVVSSDLPSIRSFSDVISICSGADEWEASILACLNEGESSIVKRRRGVAVNYDWNVLVERIAKSIGILNS